MEVSILLGIVCIVVVCGNVFVLYTLVSQPSLHTATNFLVLSLTISDLLLGVCIIPFAIIQEHSKEWLFGDIGCRIWLTADVWLSTASIYNLLAISFDRYMAVRQPIRYPTILSKRVTRLLVFMVWASSGLLALCLFILETLHNFPKHDCTPMKLSSLYITFSAMASFIVPAVVMVALNLCIFRTVLMTTRSKCVLISNGSSMRIHRGKPKVVNEVTKQYSLDSVTSELLEIPSKVHSTEFCKERNLLNRDHEAIGSLTMKTFFSRLMIASLISAGKKKRNNFISPLSSDRTRAGFPRMSLRTELRVARTTAIVVGVFIICWFPFSTIYTLQAYSVCLMPDCVSNTMYVVAFWLGYSNSAVNPLLYAAFSRDFRAAFRKILHGKTKGSAL